MNLTLRGINKSYPIGGLMSGERRQILFDVSLEVEEGTCFGLVGESGSGKSTLSRLILGLEKPDSGEILLDGVPVSKGRPRGAMSAVFQDYTSSVNPYYTVLDAVSEPLVLAGIRGGSERRRRVVEALETVGLSADFLDRYPHQLSGGEAQRVCIARSVVMRPGMLVLDEAVSSLDVSIQSQVLEMIARLRREMRLSVFFITHDMQSVTYLCDRVAFLYKGRITQNMPVSQLSRADDPYARELLGAVFPF